MLRRGAYDVVAIAGYSMFTSQASILWCRLTRRPYLLFGESHHQDRRKAWVETVKRQAQQTGIGMPEVGVFEAPEPNAFATGMSRNNALVAVSTGLLQNMNADEVEAVLGHEVSHVANGDMVTLTLVQGVVNTFVIFLSRIVGHFVDRVLLSEVPFEPERGTKDRDHDHDLAS